MKKFKKLISYRENVTDNELYRNIINKTITINMPIYLQYLNGKYYITRDCYWVHSNKKYGDFMLGIDNDAKFKITSVYRQYGKNDKITIHVKSVSFMHITNYECDNLFIYNGNIDRSYKYVNKLLLCPQIASMINYGRFLLDDEIIIENTFFTDFYDLSFQGEPDVKIYVGAYSTF